MPAQEEMQPVSMVCHVDQYWMQSKTKQLTLFIRLGPQILTFDVELPGSQDWAPKLNPFLSRDTIETVSLPEASLVYPLQIILHATWVQLKPQCKPLIPPIVHRH